MARRWPIMGWIIIETAIIIALTLDILHEFQANPMMSAWLAGRIPPPMLYILNYWTLAGLSAILTFTLGTFIAGRGRMRDQRVVQSRAINRTGSLKRRWLRELLATIRHGKGSKGSGGTASLESGSAIEPGRTVSREDPYGMIGFGLVAAGISTLSLSLFLTKAVAIEALGLSFIVLGFTALSLPRQLTGSQGMGALFQGAILEVETMLEPFSAGRAVYLPPEKNGRVAAYVPLTEDGGVPDFDEMRHASTRIVDPGQKGVLIYPVGAELATLPELNNGMSLEAALNLVLVESAEVCSRVEVEVGARMIVVAMENVKVDTRPPSYLRSFGSIPASLAACVIAVSSHTPVKVIDETGVGSKNIARFGRQA